MFPVPPPRPTKTAAPAEAQTEQAPTATETKEAKALFNYDEQPSECPPPGMRHWKVGDIATLQHGQQFVVDRVGDWGARCRPMTKKTVEVTRVNRVKRPNGKVEAAGSETVQRQRWGDDFVRISNSYCRSSGPKARLSAEELERFLTGGPSRQSTKTNNPDGTERTEDSMANEKTSTEGRYAYIRKLKEQGLTLAEATPKIKAKYPKTGNKRIKRVWESKGRGNGGGAKSKKKEAKTEAKGGGGKGGASKSKKKEGGSKKKPGNVPPPPPAASAPGSVPPPPPAKAPESAAATEAPAAS